MKIWKKIVGIILVILFAYMYAHVAKTEVVEVEFVCSVETLDAIRVKCQVNENEIDKVVCMTLTDLEDNSVQAYVEMAADELKDGKFNDFAFEKIKGCKGHEYRVTLENAEALAIKTVTNGFDTETFCMFLILMLYIAVFFKMLIKLFSR